MKRLKLGITGVLSVMLSLCLCAPNTFATNEFGIEYQGGVELAPYDADSSTGNVNIDPERLEDLTSLINYRKDGFSTNFSQKGWRDGYYKVDGKCQSKPIKYIQSTDFVNEVDGVYYTMQQGRYMAKVEMKKIVLDGDDRNYAISINSDRGQVTFSGSTFYSDAKCTQDAGVIPSPSAGHDDIVKIFVKMKLTLYVNNDTSKPFTSDQLYFGITDIDSGQSYKILNSNNYLSSSNMFAKSADVLQPTNGGDNKKNMFVKNDENGSYIYTKGNFNITDKQADLFVKITRETQEGLDLVFGYLYVAGSSPLYFAKQYTVTYHSIRGVITGITDEDIVSGDYPSGSTQEPDAGYEFVKYWIVEREDDSTSEEDIILIVDGEEKKIEPGTKLTSEQMENIKVNQDLKFTAVNVPEEEEIAVPDTGSMTGDENNSIFVLGLVFPIAIVMALMGYRIIEHKKHAVDFKK